MNNLSYLAPLKQFSPSDIPGLMMWLDSGDPSTITLNGGNVAQWNDKSGNGNNATQVNGANQPAYNAVQMNSIPVISFDGSSSQLDIPSPSAVTTTYFVVANWAPGVTFSTGPFIGGGGLFVGVITTNLYYIYSSPPNYTVGISSPTNTPTVYSYTSGTEIDGYVSNVQICSSGPGLALVGDYGFVGQGNGGSQNYNGNIAEMVLYSGVLNTAQLALVYAYLKAKWATA